MENQNDDDEPTFYGVCPIAGIGHPMENWPHCIGDKCAWFESTNQVARLPVSRFMHRKEINAPNQAQEVRIKNDELRTKESGERAFLYLRQCAE